MRSFFAGAGEDLNLGVSTNHKLACCNHHHTCQHVNMQLLFPHRTMLSFGTETPRDTAPRKCHSQGLLDFKMHPKALEHYRLLLTAFGKKAWKLTLGRDVVSIVGFVIAMASRNTTAITVKTTITITLTNRNTGTRTPRVL